MTGRISCSLEEDGGRCLTCEAYRAGRRAGAEASAEEPVCSPPADEIKNDRKGPYRCDHCNKKTWFDPRRSCLCIVCSNLKGAQIR